LSESSLFFARLIVDVVSLAIRFVALGVLLWLAIADVRTRRLSTMLVLFIGGLYFANVFVIGQPVHDVLMHIGVSLVTFFACAVLFALGALGGGDAKLATVVFLWSGPDMSVFTVLLISVAGLLVALLSLAVQRSGSAATQTARWRRALAPFSSEQGVPYGVALAIGGAVVLVCGSLPHIHSQ
jgi:prepilin peptidase CpaA